MRLMLVVVCLSSSISGMAGAQSAADYRKQLDRLEPQWRAARDAVDAAERNRRLVARSVTIERGSLRIVADSTVAHHVVEAADIAARDIDATFGAGARGLAGSPIVIRRHRAIRRADTTFIIRVRAGGREQSVTLQDPVQTRSQLVAALRGPLVTGAMHAALDDTVRRWFRTPLRAGPESRGDREGAYLELVTASTTNSRLCVAGDIAGCRQLLGLTPVTDPVVDGLTATQRRATVAARAPELRTPGNTVEFDRCVSARDDAACVARLRELPIEAFAGFLSSTYLRHTFARAVLEQGQTGAYSRLVASHGHPLDARFATAGKIPADSLVAHWRTDVLSTRPWRTPVTPATASATLAWILAFGALALRSTRWR